MPKPLEVLETGLQNLMFALLGSGLALVQLFLSSDMEVFTLCHCMLEVFLFDIYRGLQLGVCLESQKRLWSWTFQQSWNC